ncbi:MAG: hypothetical protein U9Q94_05745, partial [Candidatus Bipolaricaulota bacterium]|nr:hypothetical protein [Candidatus Bipolaricaulota bacterium]
NFILDLESNINHMARLGNAAITGSNILSPDEVIARIDAVTVNDARRIIESYVDSEAMNIAVVGPQPNPSTDPSDTDVM